MKPYQFVSMILRVVCSQAPKLLNASNKHEGFVKNSTI